MMSTVIESKQVAAPIGWEGRTLQEMLHESDAQFERTGSYWGLDGRLAMQSSDPLGYEKLFSRVRGGLTSARETAMNISASPIIKEIGELCFALYTPEGDSIALSTGIIVHVHTMSEAIKYMIRNGYENDPGIRPGDIFTNNDSMVGNVHNPDIQTILPIFWEGELIAWVGGVTHELDVGARVPGGSPNGPTSRYEDGIDLSARKVGSDDELWADHVIACQRAVRTPMYWMLDEKTRLTGCLMIREVLERIVAEEGIDTYKQFAREAIEEGRRSFASRVRQMTVPGRYRAPAFAGIPFADEQRMPTHARRDSILHACVELRLTREGMLELDFDGTSSWGYHSLNCSPAAMQGALWVLLTQTLICNDKVNDGAYYAMKSNFPAFSVSNYSIPSASTGNAWSFLCPAFTGFAKSMARTFQARGFVEEVLAPYALPSNAMQGAGIDQYGRQSAMTNFGLSCVGGGAKMVADGLDFASAMFNPEGDMGDMEVWEELEPFLYLSQRVKPNTAGPGRRRGGSGYECLRLAWKTPFYEMSNNGMGQLHWQSGLWGGYPSASMYRHNIRNTNVLDLAAAGKPFPLHEGDPGNSELLEVITGDHQFDQIALSLPDAMHHGDLYLCMFHGGSGIGDPIERPYESVVEDVEGGHLLQRYADPIYGVITGDPEASETRRVELRASRVARARPVREWMVEERQRVLDGEFSEQVQRMFAESIRLSPRFAAEFREFWDLPADFDYDVRSLEVELSMSMMADAAHGEDAGDAPSSEAGRAAVAGRAANNTGTSDKNGSAS
jgi:N-methylhydantoinase B